MDLEAHNASDVWYRSVSSYSESISKRTGPDRLFIDWIRRTVTGNEIIGGNAYIQSPGVGNRFRVYNYIHEVREYTWHEEYWGDDHDILRTVFIMIPYNRNAYYAWEETLTNREYNDSFHQARTVTFGNQRSTVRHLVRSDSPECSPGADFALPNTTLIPYIPPDGWTNVSTLHAPDITVWFDAATKSIYSVLNTTDACENLKPFEEWKCEFWVVGHNTLGEGINTASFMGPYPGAVNETAKWAMIGELTGTNTPLHETTCDFTLDPPGFSTVVPALGNAVLSIPRVTLQDTRLVNIKIIANYLPDGSVLDLGEFQDEETYDNISTTSKDKFFVQTAVLGKKAVIYSDITQIEENFPEGSPWYHSEYFNIGIMPAMPDPPGYRNQFYNWLTFVGVNGP
jgi:hypothetical protein